MGKEVLNIEAIIAYLKNQTVKKVWVFGSYASGKARSMSINALTSSICQLSA